MKNNYLSSLLHLSDPTLPIGGFSHSNGLETYVQAGLITNATTAERFIKNMLTQQLLYNDAAFVRLAYAATEANHLLDILWLDQECTALKSSKEMRQASQKLAVRLLKIFTGEIDYSIFRDYEKAIEKKDASGHYCITFGLCARLLDIPLEATLLAFYYNAAVGMVTNSVKLIPLGQLDGQSILFRMQRQLPLLVQQTLGLKRDKVGICSQGFEIRCMQHERLYSRLYMS